MEVDQMRDPAVIETQLAMDQLEYLREHEDVCAALSIHVGHHPYVRYDGEKYLVAENMGYGEIEVQHMTAENLVTTFADNPVDLRPVQDVTDGNGDPMWDRVENTDEKVTVLG